ncbi:Ig-like domain-containing protein [Halostella salina]|uniref:Ig-like domain-containing protein n=1 Tax=Halostella salina TaxID=1547897 RepID=UPI000EF7DC3A|nr:Ig-like domain-containing protein [Halostella salina]
MASSRAVAAVVCGLLVCGAVVPLSGAAASVTPAEGDRAVPVGGDTVVAVAQENNTTTQHENPASAGEDGDLENVNGWLVNRLSERLGDSTLQLSQGEYDAAREVVGDDYSDRLGQLVDVAGETSGGGGDGGDGGGGGDDNQNDSASFDRAQEEQAEYVSEVQEYRETRDRYEAAKERGNETEARRAARRLDRIAQNVTATGSELTDEYEAITNRTDADLTAEIRTVGNISANVSRTQSAIRTAEFIETRLTITARTSEITFLNPLEVTGRLTDANGSALANRTVAVRLGSRTQLTTTNATGYVTASFRPTVQPLGEGNATVRYVPEPDSIYLGDATSVPVEVDQVTPTVTLDETPSTTAYDEQITVSGSVAAESVPAAGVPVAIRLGDTRLGTVRTDGDGEFTFSARTPAAIPTGTAALNASIPVRNRALAATGTGTEVTVEETDASLTVAASQDGADAVRATGRLTANGTPVSNQRIELRVNGTVVETVQTDANGQYNASLAVPASIADTGGAVEVTAVYATERTNLDDASARTAIVLPTPAEVADEQPLWQDWRVRGGIGVVGLLVLSGAAYWWRRRRQESVPEEDGSSQSDSAPGDTDIPEDEGDEAFPTDVITSDVLENGQPDRAVELAYSDVRRRISDALDVPSVRTHWEFYQACRDAGLDTEGVKALERLTEAYEQAAYAPEELSIAEADEALEAVDAVR